MINIKNYNDNELLYLIREGNEEALEIMFKKYEHLILTKIKKFKFNGLYKEDYLQEGRLMLHKAIRLYDTSSLKTFNKYFDLILTHRFISISRKNEKEKNTYAMAEVNPVEKNVFERKFENIDFSKIKLSPLEREILKLRFFQNSKISVICQKLNVNEKTVYNTIQRIKRKIEVLK